MIIITPKEAADMLDRFHGLCHFQAIHSARGIDPIPSLVKLREILEIIIKSKKDHILVESEFIPEELKINCNCEET